MPIVAVDIVIFNPQKNKVLLFRRENEPARNKYYTPGGRVNKNEKMLAAARRKLREETNIKVNPQYLIYAGVSEEFFPNSIFGKVKSHFLVINYALILKDNIIIKLRLDPQHSDLKWFNANDKHLPKYVKSKINMAKAIKNNYRIK